MKTLSFCTLLSFNFILVWSVQVQSDVYGSGNKILFDYEDDMVGRYGASLDEEDTGPKLFLTPFINSGEIGRGRSLALVTLGNIRSYSGYLTLNETFNSNVFFWFFPSLKRVEKSPLILWLQGGPGVSSLFGLFSQNGPFLMKNPEAMELRDETWIKTHSILYIDSPIGTGFSFSESERGHSKSDEEVGEDLYMALAQFFALFPEVRPAPLFIGGISYAGKFGPWVAKKIHEGNVRVRGSRRMNLKGLAIGSGYFDPPSQADYGDYLYHMGLISRPAADYFLAQEKMIKVHLRKGDFNQATLILENLMAGSVLHRNKTIFSQLSGYEVSTNVLEPSPPKRVYYFTHFLDLPSIRRMIHAGAGPFVASSRRVATELRGERSKSVSWIVEELLTNGYSFLVFASQFDIIVPHTGIDLFLNSLDWPGSSDFEEAQRKQWAVFNEHTGSAEIAGYVKAARKLTYVFLRKAGHNAVFDQPKWTYDMMYRFTHNISF